MFVSDLYATNRSICASCAVAPTRVGSFVHCQVYIIGGLVDRNRFKNITAEKAAAQHIATARFPIAENQIKVAGPLTVNHSKSTSLLHCVLAGLLILFFCWSFCVYGHSNRVLLPAYDILLRYGESSNWKTAFEAALPKRPRFNMAGEARDPKCSEATT